MVHVLPSFSRFVSGLVRRISGDFASGKSYGSHIIFGCPDKIPPPFFNESILVQDIDGNRRIFAMKFILVCAIMVSQESN
jgi:hypothetical protein